MRLHTTEKPDLNEAQMNRQTSVTRCEARWSVLASMAIFLCGCGEGLEPSSRAVKTTVPERTVLPVNWSLTDVKGRTIEATILGRDEKSLRFKRLSDGKDFEIPLSTLSEADRNRAMKISPSPRPAEELEETWEIQRKQDELDRLSEDIVRLQQVFSASNSAIEKRSLTSQLERLGEKESKIRAELDELRQQENRGGQGSRLPR